MAILEAAERQLTKGPYASQIISFAFSHDEELGKAMTAPEGRCTASAAWVRIGMALDEAVVVLDGVIAGVTRPVAMIGIAEKGYVSVGPRLLLRVGTVLCRRRQYGDRVRGAVARILVLPCRPG